MPSQETIALALAIPSTLILTRLLLPNVLAILGLISLKNGFTGGPEDANSYWPFRIDDDLYKEMLALGFRPEGTAWEQLPFTRRFEHFVFTRPGEKCFGVLYPNDQIMPRRGSFMTVFETGGVVFTKNYCGGVEIQERDFLAMGARTDPVRDLPPQPSAPADSSWKPVVLGLVTGLVMATLVSGPGLWSDQRVIRWVGIALGVIVALFQIRPRRAMPRRTAQQPLERDFRLPLSETLARHGLNVSRLIAQGQQPPTVFDGEEFLATQRRYYRHPRLRRQRQSSMTTLLLSKLIVLAPLPAVLFYSVGVDNPLPWGVLLAEGLVGLYLRYGCSSAKVVNILRSLVRGQ